MFTAEEVKKAIRAIEFLMRLDNTSLDITEKQLLAVNLYVKEIKPVQESLNLTGEWEEWDRFKDEQLLFNRNVDMLSTLRDKMFSIQDIL